MKLNKPGAEWYVPDGKDFDEAVARTTHMGISAHQDDLEIMAYHGIVECFGNKDNWFFGTVVTDGAGSARDGIYASYSDEDMRAVRKMEQKKAAYIGEYGLQALLDYTSAEVKNRENRQSTEELKCLIEKAAPRIIYTHNLADKHDTHVAVALKVIAAIRALPRELRPNKLYGCEVWRSLDWMVDSDKVMFNVSSHANLAAALVGVFDSQICGGKRYDLATAGRRIANATYAESHQTDTSQSMNYGMDLTPLIQEPNLSIEEYVKSYINRFSEDVCGRINR